MKIYVYEQRLDKQKEYLWKDRRVFAIDGSKVNLPRKTIELTFHTQKKTNI